jgi:hypothetical protein
MRSFRNILLPLVAMVLLGGCSPFGSDAPTRIHDPHPVSTPDEDPDIAAGVKLDPDALAIAVAARRAVLLLGRAWTDDATRAAAGSLYDTDVWPILEQPVRDLSPQLHDQLVAARQALPSASTRPALAASPAHQLVAALASPTRLPDVDAPRATAGIADGMLLATDVDAQRMVLPRTNGTPALVTPALLTAELDDLDAHIGQLAARQRAAVAQGALALRRHVEALVRTPTSASADAVDEAANTLRDTIATSADIDTSPPLSTTGTDRDLTAARQAMQRVSTDLQGSAPIADAAIREPRIHVDHSAAALAGMAPTQLGQLRSCLGTAEVRPRSSATERFELARSWGDCLAQLDELHRLVQIDLQAR